MAMTDTELTVYLCLTPEEAAIVIPKIPPGRRAVYDKMAEVERDAMLWLAGFGPRPMGVLLDVDRRKKLRV
jgi:hypothetical protein